MDIGSSLKAYYGARKLRSSIFMWRSYRRLFQLKGNQSLVFNELRPRFLSEYTGVSSERISDFITPWWSEMSKEFEKLCLPAPPIQFLRSPAFMNAMFVTAGGQWLKSQLELLRGMFPLARLKELLLEDYAGMPIIMNSEFLTSHNSIHHLYHFARYAKSTGVEPANVESILEWGGGYGNLAKLLFRLSESKRTYTIIDLPLLSCVQWIYLSTVVGAERVNLVHGGGEGITSGKINLLPLTFLEECNIHPDLFISTWALSESSRRSQDYAVEKGWFDAKHLLLAYNVTSHDFPETSSVHKLAIDRGVITEEIKFLPGSYYAFK